MKKEKRPRDNKVKYGTISLPIPLINSIKEKIKGTGLNSPSAYVAFVLRQILSSPIKDDKEPFNKEEEQEVKRRLKTLGYD